MLVYWGSVRFSPLLQCKVVYRWDTTNCCFRSDKVFLQKLVTLRRKTLPPASWQKRQDLKAEADSHKKQQVVKIGDRNWGLGDITACCCMNIITSLGTKILQTLAGSVCHPV